MVSMRGTMALLVVYMLGCAGPGGAEYTLRLDGASISRDEACGDDSDGSWDGSDNAPDPMVLVVDNASGDEWASAELQEEWEPEWNQAVFDGSSVRSDDLRDWGVTVALLEVDGFDEDAIVDESYRLSDDDIDARAFEIANDCGSVRFSLVAG